MGGAALSSSSLKALPVSYVKSHPLNTEVSYGVVWKCRFRLI